MRGLRSLIVLIVVLGGLGAYIYFVTWKKPAESSTSKQEKVFAGLDAGKVEEVKVKSEKGDVTTLKKENGAWQIVAPIAVKADESEASTIASNLAQLEIVRVIDENPTDLKDYGLATPRIELDFKGGGDKSGRRLTIGDKSPTGSDLFARRNDDKRVFLIPSFQESTFNRSTFELREKTLLKFDRDKVDAITVNTGAKSLALVKSGSDWKLTKPIEARADYGSVEGLIGRLQSGNMKSIAAEQPGPADLKKYGLDKPSASVEIKAGSSTATLLVGSKADEGTVYARDASKNMVVTVENALADEVKKDADQYRRKDIFEFRSFNADRLEFTRNGQTIVFEKVKGTGEKAQDKWRRASPNAADVDKDKVDSLISRLSNMRASSFTDKPVKASELVVSAKFDDGKKEERATFGKIENDVYVTRPGEPGAAKVDVMDFNDSLKTLDEISK
jgi:hypothetical protein